MRSQNSASPERRRASRRAVLASLGASGLASLAGCTALARDGERSYDVGMTATAFRPPQVTVSAGETVVWRNTSTRAHSITAYERAIPKAATYFASGGFESEAAARESWNGSLDGGALDNGHTYSHTFEVPGRYDYFCIPHEQGGMVGTVVVEE